LQEVQYAAIVPTLEDKVLQRAIVMLLEPVYEQDFLDCSYGFRPGRSAHQALDSLRQQTMNYQVGWILEVDIRKFFDNLDHGHLRTFFQLRVCDGVLLRLIGKWLKAGVMEDGSVSYPDAGSPQGGVVSPLLSNVFLHYVLDLWFVREVRPRLRHGAFLIRFAEDFAMGFRSYRDAQRVMEVLPKRFGKYGLTIHPDKTRLVPFRSPSSTVAEQGEEPRQRPGTFDLLGFTHFWSRSRRHEPIGFQQRKLNEKLRGHDAYYGITGNSWALARFHREVRECWQKWLNRRNRKRIMGWSMFQRLTQRYPLAPVRTVHSVITRTANP
jgi:group II intron reverse transcriptase/maturase